MTTTQQKRAATRPAIGLERLGRPAAYAACGSLRTSRFLRSGRMQLAFRFCLAFTCCLSLSGCGSSSSNTAPDIESSSQASAVTAQEPDPHAGHNHGDEAIGEASAATNDNPEIDRDTTIEQAESLLAKGDLAGAEAKLSLWLVSDPEDAAIIFRLASLKAQQNDLAAGIELLSSIPADHPEAGLPALGQSADWCFALERFDDAEKRYLKILEFIPGAPEAHRKLAFLFNRQGRRHEAAKHVYALCQQGNVRQDELHSLIHLSDAMIDEQGSSLDTESERYTPIGSGAFARRHFMEENYQAALDDLQADFEAKRLPPSLVALYGRAAAEAQNNNCLNAWFAQMDDATKEFPDYWAALGLFLMSESRLEESARSLLEAINRDPTDFRSISRLRSVLVSLDQEAAAKRFEERFQTLTATLTENNAIADAVTPDIESMMRLADLLESIDRNLEAALWRTVAAVRGQAPKPVLDQLNQRLQQLIQSRTGLPDQDSRLCNVKIEALPLPELDQLRTAKPAAPERERRITEATPARFENIASNVGISHTYQVASDTVEKGFAVYQSVGGAAAAFDYDQDGRIDLYFAQGDCDPPQFDGGRGNQLYRALDNDHAIDVSDSANVGLRTYSTGVTVGDWNQDGFPDLAVANLGRNVLLINNGDGTFSESMMDDRDDKTLMTTSLAIGDVTGDHLPDIVEVNYLHDPQIAKRPERNEAGDVLETMMPLDFSTGLDRIVINDGKGAPNFHELGSQVSDSRAGLGVVIADFDHQSGNEIFVGNDVYANQLWRRDENAMSWFDVAMLVGCAYGFSGSKTASMGIAASDFDRNGWLDLHITNFQQESVSHYLNNSGSFQDRNIQFGLSQPSQSVLGFGTQGIDYQNDGEVDLIVANGHIEDPVGSNAPFRQPAQLFCNLGDRFELVSVQDDSGYWSNNHVGRGLAKLDWNRDGLTDYVVTHLGEPSALLLNRSPTDNHWLQIELRGVESERDAIGARVEVKSGDDTLTEWVTAGDGFFSHNESVLSFGLGEATSVDEIVVHWPSGHEQTFTATPVDQRLLIIEHADEPFRHDLK